jgi:hypothetical protein
VPVAGAEVAPVDPVLGALDGVVVAGVVVTGVVFAGVVDVVVRVVAVELDTDPPAEAAVLPDDALN